MLEEPQVAFIDCNDCAKHIYNLDTGEPETYEADGKKLPVLRGKFDPPCGSCPKGQAMLSEDELPSPDFEGKKSLNRRNQMALRFWHEIQATCGCMPLPAHLENCAVFAANMAEISRIHRNAEAHNKVKAYEKAKRKV